MVARRARLPAETKTPDNIIMATRSFIAQKLTDGSFQAIYCHWDGYPEHVGDILFHHYSNTAKLASLLSLGSISSLGERLEPTPGGGHTFEKPEVGVVVAYHRDRGEKIQEAGVYADLAALKAACDDAGGEYLYTWADGAWTCNDKPLADLLAETGLIQPQAAEPAKAADVAAPAVDWAVVGPKLAVALEGARKALRVALPHCPADEEHNGPAVLVGEWLDEVNEALALLPSA